MKKIFTIISLIVCVVFAINAQNPVEIHLNNGYFIRGNISKEVPGKSYTIVNEDGITKEINATDVNYIDFLYKYVEYNRAIGIPSTGKGYKGFVDLGYSLFTSNPEAGTVNLTTTHGYYFSKNVFVGVGTGIHYEFGNEYYDDILYIPVYGDVRFSFPISNKWSMFTDVRVGGNFYTGESSFGLYANPSVGVRIPVSNKNGINIAVGYETMSYSYEGYYSYNTETEFIHNISFKVGFDF